MKKNTYYDEVWGKTEVLGLEKLNTPSDTDKMEKGKYQKLFDAIYKEKAPYANVIKILDDELQKAADSARVKVVEEIREYVGNSVCPCRLEEYYPPHASKHAYYEGMNFVLNILNFLTDTNTKEGRP